MGSAPGWVVGLGLKVGLGVGTPPPGVGECVGELVLAVSPDTAPFKAGSERFASFKLHSAGAGSGVHTQNLQSGSPVQLAQQISAEAAVKFFKIGPS